MENRQLNPSSLVLNGMRIIILFLFAALASSTLRAGDEYPIPEMPTQIVLTSGRVLKDVTVIRWEKNRVLIRWAGGKEPIPFSIFKSPSQAEVERMSRGLEDYSGEISGQIYLVTNGAGSYKFANAEVYLTPLGADGKPSRSKDSSIYARTDADGRFVIKKAASGPFILRCTARRMVGGSTQFYHWNLIARELRDPKNVVMSNSNISIDTE